jgi:RNA polymerase sigma-70 factor (ECF subfamily)
MSTTFEELYNQYFDDVYRFVLFKTGSAWDTDDLVSDIFRKAFQSLRKSGIEPSGAKAWLFVIARNTVIDYYRRKKEVAYGDDPEVYGYAESQLFPDQGDARGECLEQSLKELSALERELLNLKYIAGLKYADIAELTGKAEDWLKVRTHRLKQKMARLITVCMEGKQ